MKTFRLIILLIAFPSLPRLLAGDGAPTDGQLAITPDIVDRLLHEARAANPALEASGARADAASAAIDSVRKWEDPTFSLGLWQSAPQGMKASQEGNIIYGVEQRLPVFGRPELARNTAEARAATARLGVAYDIQRLRRDLSVNLHELAFADRSLELGREDLRWLEATVSAVDSRYRAGKSSQVEWLRAQTERAKVADNITTLELEREHEQVLLNRLLNRNLHTPWPRVALPDVAGRVPFSDALVRDAMDWAPKLKILREETEESEAEALLTRRQRLPAIGVGLEARQYSGDAGIREGMLTVDFTLPWLNGKQYDSDLRRDLALKRARERDAADYELSIREDVHHLTVDLDNSRRQALLYRGQIIPLTEQTLSSAEAAWESGLGPFQDVLDAHRMLVENRLTVARAVTDQADRLADLTLLTGVYDLSSYTSAHSPEEAHH
jgi:outer membrane protein TolC